MSDAVAQAVSSWSGSSSMGEFCKRSRSSTEALKQVRACVVVISSQMVPSPPRGAGSRCCYNRGEAVGVERRPLSTQKMSRLDEWIGAIREAGYDDPSGRDVANSRLHGGMGDL